MSQAEQQPAAPQAAEKPKKGKLAIAIASVVILGAGGAVAFKGGGASLEESALAEGHAAEAGSEEQGSVTPEAFVLNLADPEGDRYLRLSLRILLDRASVAEQVAAEVLELARVRDRLLTVLSSKKADEITSYEGKEALRAELARAVAPLFGEAKVLDVYFTEFLVQ
jgi:flagellar protein FliL